MSARVSLWRAALPLFDEEGGHFVWTIHERFEHKALTMRGRLPPRRSRRSAKRLVQAPPESLQTPVLPREAPIQVPFDAGLAPGALLTFGALHAPLVLAWAISGASWNWRSACALLTAGAALALSVALQRRPSRRLVLCGLGVALVSLARTVGVDWTWSTCAVLLPTAALTFVLARVVLPASLPALLSRVLRAGR